MSTKTFKSASSGRVLEVERGAATVDLFIGKAGSFKCFEVNLADAPTLALAILEAAGIEACAVAAYVPGTDIYLSSIAGALTAHIKATESKAKEAADREALEREALELLNAVRASNGNAPVDSLDKIAGARDSYLTVARKAREMYKAKS